MKPFLLVATALLLSPVAMLAQPSAFKAQRQPLAVLPGEPQSVFVADSSLYVCLDRLLMVSRWKDGELIGFVPDTDAVKLSQGVTSLHRVSADGDGCYYTAVDRRGRSTLHYAYRDGKKLKHRRVDLGGLEVRQPTFSADGNIIVFAARDREKSRGGFDLWYSRRVGGEWGKPANLGDRINTAGDDISPCISGDYLFYSSNGRDESKGKLNIYVTQLVNDGVVNDTAGMLQFGRGRVQRLPEPFNYTMADCSDMVLDETGSLVFWRSGQQFQGCSAPLYAESVWGYVKGDDGRPLASVSVSVSEGHREVCSTATDASGFYRVCLPVGRSYSVLFRKENHFAGRLEIAPRRDRTGLLIGESRHDMVLSGITVGQPLYYADLFGPNASVELNDHGREILDTYVRFLADNPALGATFMLGSDLMSNAEFNALLTAERLKTVEAYLRTRLPDTVEVQFENLCSGREGCADATGESRLAVVLR